MIRNLKSLISAMMLCASLLIPSAAHSQETAPVSRPAIEQMSDRFIIHVRELNLSGKESLLDVLQMIPDFMMKDYYTVIENYTLRRNNIPLKLDPKTYLTRTRASEIEDIQVCNYPSVVKGVDGLQGVIDIYYREGVNGVRGRGNMEIESDGRGSSIGELYLQKGNFRTWAVIQGIQKDDYLTIVSPSSNLLRNMRERYENAKLGTSIDFTKSDRLSLNLYQKYGHTSLEDDGIYIEDNEVNVYDKFSHIRNYGVTVDYIHKFRNRSELSFEAVMDYNDNPSHISREVASPMFDGYIHNFRNTKARNQYAYLNYGIPVMKNAWLIAGVEGGYKTAERKKNFYTRLNVSEDISNFTYDDDFFYGDLYAQMTYDIGPVTLTLGDRARHMEFKTHLDANGQNVYHNYTSLFTFIDDTERKPADAEHTIKRTDNTFLASAIWKIDNKNTVKATYNHKFFTPANEDLMHFGFVDDGSKMTYNSYAIFYTTTPMVDIYDLGYTYTGKDISFMGNVINRSMSHYGIKSSNTGFKASMFGSKGNFRLMAGASLMTTENYSLSNPTRRNCTTYNLRLVPMMNLNGGWLFQATCIYDSKVDLGEYFYSDEQFYASLKCTKYFNTHWEVYSEWHDLSNYPKHKRAISFGATYYF